MNSPQFVEETIIESRNKTCEDAENPTEAWSHTLRQNLTETGRRFPQPLIHRLIHTPPDNAHVDNSDHEQFGEKLSIGSPHEFVEETRTSIAHKTRQGCRELAQGAKHATENSTELALASE